jgi:hypothetical protein
VGADTSLGATIYTGERQLPRGLRTASVAIEERARRRIFAAVAVRKWCRARVRTAGLHPKAQLRLIGVGLYEARQYVLGHMSTIQDGQL